MPLLEAPQRKKITPEVLETEGEGWLKVEKFSSQQERTERDERSGAAAQMQICSILKQFEKRGRKNEKTELERGKKKREEKNERENSQLAQAEIFGLALKFSGCPDNKPHGLRSLLFPLQAAEWKRCRSVQTQRGRKHKLKGYFCPAVDFWYLCSCS